MANYYESLKIQPSASTSEINAAIDEQYNQWRRLVTHHDPDVVNQANQALRTLEVMRSTLTNPDKRAGYDAAVGLAGAVGGLADPNLLLQNLAAKPLMTPPAGMGAQPAAAQASAAPPAKQNIWECYKCHADNPPHSVHCFKCGAELMRACPECNEVASMVATKMCGKCGYNYDIATERLALKQQILMRQNQKKEITLRMSNEMSKSVGQGCGFQFLGLVIFISALGIAGLTLAFILDQYFLNYGSGYWFLAAIAFVVALIWKKTATNGQKNEQDVRVNTIREELNSKDNELSHLVQKLDSLAKRQ